MSARNEILKRLTTDHPEACALFVRLLQAIDLEKKVISGHDEIQLYNLSDLTHYTEDALEVLSTSDMTQVEADHSFRLLHALVVDLESKGIVLESLNDERELQFALEASEPASPPSVETLSLAHAREEVADDFSLSIWRIEIGLFDYSNDPRTPFETHDLYVAAESAREALEALDEPIDGLLIANNVNVEATGDPELFEKAPSALENSGGPAPG